MNQAKRVRKILYALRVPSYRDIKTIYRINMIQDARSTMEEINKPEQIYGQDTGSTKGLTTSKKPSLIEILLYCYLRNYMIFSNI